MGGLALGLGIGPYKRAGATGVSLAPLAGTGPVLEDDFERPNSTTIGNGWVEYGADFFLTGGVVSSPTTAGIIASIQQESVNGGAMFARAEIWGNNGIEFPALALRCSVNSSTVVEGYVLRANVRDDVVNLYRAVGGSWTQLDSAALVMVQDEWLEVELYVADGVQRGRVYAPGADSAVTVQGTDTAHDGAGSRFAALVHQCTNASSSRFNDFVWSGPSPFITVSGLSAGNKAKVLNGAEAVVAEATESGGVATIDCSMFGGASELVPVGGWAALIVTDAADAELLRFDSAGVYPGYGYIAS